MVISATSLGLGVEAEGRRYSLRSMASGSLVVVRAGDGFAQLLVFGQPIIRYVGWFLVLSPLLQLDGCRVGLLHSHYAGFPKNIDRDLLRDERL